MSITANEVISHCLTILEGHTGQTFVTDEMSYSEMRDGVGTAGFRSTDVPVTGGIMKMMADKVRVQMTFHVFSPKEISEIGTYEIATDERGHHSVSVALVFTRPDGNEFTTQRQFQFSGQFFRRFDQ